MKPPPLPKKPGSPVVPLLAAALAWRAWQGRRHVKILRQWPTTERKIWLTLDDGPNRRDTEGMMDALADFGGQASFFVIGREVESRRKLLRQLVERGHSVENHTYAHRSALQWLAPRSCIQQEIARASHAIRCAGVEAPVFFRAPAGLWSKAMVEAALAEGLQPVGWSAGGGEGSCHGDLLAAVHRALEQLHPGAIVLLHQGGRSGRVAVLRLFLEGLKREGWSLFDPSVLRQSTPARHLIPA